MIKMKNKHILIMMMVILIIIPFISATAINNRQLNAAKINNCELLAGNGNNNNVNIYFFGADYNSASDLKIDINRLLYSNSTSQGLGLLTIEPFKTNINKINIYFIPVNLNNKDFDACYLAVENISKYCKNYNYEGGKDFIHVIVNQDGLINGAYGQGGGNSCSEALRKGGGNYVDSVSLFEHEMGHNFGLVDNYVNIYYANGWPVPYKIDNQPNCDPTPGCPKWCSGASKSFGMTSCSFYSKNMCNLHAADGCLWLNQTDSYYGTRCIQNIDLSNKNIGTQCIAGTGCYAGCSGAGYRPTPINNFVYVSTYNYPRTDSQGKNHMYNPVAENYIKNALFPGKVQQIINGMVSLK